MKDINDIAYVLPAICPPEGIKDDWYGIFQGQIQKKGYVIINKVKIYSAELAYFFHARNFPARCEDTDELTTIKTIPYLETFVKGFHEGVEYFDQEFRVKVDTLYSTNNEAYVKDIHTNYYKNYHTKYTLTLKGWQQIKGSYTFTLTHEVIKGYGFFSGIVSSVDDMKDTFSEIFKSWEGCGQAAAPQKTVQPKPDIKPIFKPEEIDTIYGLLKDFFNPEQQAQLKDILTTGNDTNPRLLFLDNGNRLADAFKRLITSDLITGVEKKQLETWVQRNFIYWYRGKVHKYTPHYLNDIISKKDDNCRKPIFIIELNKVTGKKVINKA